MSNATSLQTEEDYELALKEVEAYFDNIPEPGTEAAERFKRLTNLILEYEAIHYPLSEGKGRDDLIRRFKEGLMLASDKQYILCMLLSATQVASSPEMTDPGTAGSSEAATVCAELYQVIGYLAQELEVLDHPDVQRALDNASANRLVHRDLLPWPKQPLQPTDGADLT